MTIHCRKRVSTTPPKTIVSDLYSMGVILCTHLHMCLKYNFILLKMYPLRVYHDANQIKDEYNWCDLKIRNIEYVTVSHSTFDILQKHFNNPKNLFQKFYNLSSFITITPPLKHTHTYCHFYNFTRVWIEGKHPKLLFCTFS